MIFSVFFITSAIAYSYGVPLVSDTNTQINDKSTTIDNYPYQAQLQSSTNQFSCATTIISSKVVLTTGQCIYQIINKPNYGGYTIRGGTSYPSKEGSIHEIKKIIIHENYKGYDPKVERGPINDIALVFLKNPFKIDSSRKPIPLYSSAVEFESKTKAIITGFGMIRVDEGLFNQLQVSSVPYVTKRNCNIAYRYLNGINEGQICAGYSGIRGNDTCETDIAGPLVIDGNLVGIFSYSMGCTAPYYPGVYTEVAYFYDWIFENAGLLSD